MGTALEVNHVWKKFNRGEFNDSLRDAVPAMLKSMVGLGPSRSELQKNEFWALKDVDFKVEEGESVALIGHNGAGKSTLLKIFSKILKPNRGSIKVNGRMRALIEIGSGFHGDLTGRENIFLNGSILGMSRKEIQSKFDAIVDFAGIGEFLDMPVKRYSSGMYARLGFAVAAHLEPEILIVDEVLAVGDMAFQRKCMGKMNEVVHEGRTVVFVSHNMVAVRNLCHRAILFDHGEAVMDDVTALVVERYFDLLHEKQKEHQQQVLPEDRDLIKITEVLVGDSLSTLSRDAYCECYGPLFIRVYFQCSKPVSNAYFSVVVSDYEENHIIGVNTRITQKSHGDIQKSGYIDFYIPHFSVLKGIYGLRACIYTPDKHGFSYRFLNHFVCENTINVQYVDYPDWKFASYGFEQRTFTPYDWNITYM
ncbi:MAG: ATP-binding cassette domain-containing protein [Thermoguttaceae bacterium]|nr:ATP-binding cassette domain-containing protein [Thermoguttaceae bacterium]